MAKTEEKLFLPNIGLCILMDLIGMSSYFFPGMGEFSDIIWAPISGYVFFKIFGGRLGLIGGVLDFLEEILPFTDIIPSFTIAWFIRKKAMEKLITSQPGLANFLTDTDILFDPQFANLGLRYGVFVLGANALKLTPGLAYEAVANISPMSMSYYT